MCDFVLVRKIAAYRSLSRPLAPMTNRGFRRSELVSELGQAVIRHALTAAGIHTSVFTCSPCFISLRTCYFTVSWCILVADQAARKTNA